MWTACRQARLGGCEETHADMDPADHEYTLFRLHLSGDICRQPAITRIDLARFQRAAESSQHSAGRRRDDIIDGRRVRLRQGRRINVIVLRDGAVNAEGHRIGLARQMRDAQRAPATLESNP